VFTLTTTPSVVRNSNKQNRRFGEQCLLDTIRKTWRCGQKVWGLGTKERPNALGGTLQAQAEMTMMRVIAKKVAAGAPGAVVRHVIMIEEERMHVDDEG
jgi:hypothetical protein